MSSAVNNKVTGIPGDDDHDRGVRVFVSSTFVDMQGERDELAKTTFPALRRRYRERGIEVLDVDLRWGVNEQDVTLNVCLSAVKRCNYFLGLLGQRYGTLVTDGEVVSQLQQDFPVVRDGIGCSLTEVEIMQGLRADSGIPKQLFFFERDRGWLDTLDRNQRVAFEEQGELARARLADLKTRIRKSVGTVNKYKTPTEIGGAVKDALSAALDARFPHAEAPDAFTQTHRLHAAYARDRFGPHIGAKSYLDRLDQWMGDARSAPILITGASGSGKSKLIAIWLQAQRSKHRDAIMFAHYLGASPDSADPALLMRRLWEHLNRATGETVDLPAGDVEMMDLAGRLAQRIAQASAFAERNDNTILIALDGLDKLGNQHREHDLRWLPSALPPRVKLLGSSLDGDAKTAALARGWSELAIYPLDDAGQRLFIAQTLQSWDKSDLPPARTQRIIARQDLSGLPLFLKTVLEELRVSTVEAAFDANLDEYLKSVDMPDLFARVLQRLERECGRTLVERALALIGASRAGLEEAEVIAITGTTPLAWERLRNALADNLRDHAGRLAFSHDYLNQAVATRYLDTDDKRRAAHLAIADQFAKRDADARQAEELPYQLRAAENWERLGGFLVDMTSFRELYRRGNVELLGYWLPLKARGRDAETLLCSAFEARVGEPEQWAKDDIQLCFELTEFLGFSGAAGDDLVRLGVRRTQACERVFGANHHETITSLSNLASTLHARGDLQRAQDLYGTVCEARMQADDGEGALIALNNLALVLLESGDHARAQALQERVLDTRQRALGSEHVDTLVSMSNLGVTLFARGDYIGAQDLFSRAHKAQERVLGPEHPDTLKAMINSAQALRASHDLVGAQELTERALATMRRALGPEHPDTLTSMGRLAQILQERNNLRDAEKLHRQVLEILTRVHGADHLDAIRSMGNIGGILLARGDLSGAQALQERVLQARTRLLGAEHPETLTAMNNLSGTLAKRGDRDRARQLLEQVVDARRRVLGQSHPHTMTAEANLAALNSTKRT